MSDSEMIIIGIDLGTTNSVVACVEHNEPVVLPNFEGRSKTPSAVAFTDADHSLVGEAALRQLSTNPRRTITAVKRLMGRTYGDVADVGERFAYSLAPDEHGQVLIDIEGIGYSPQQISSLVLCRLKEAAEQHYGREIDKAIITVPAWFDDCQRQATVEAGEMAGLEVLRLVNEPTAAAMAYGLGKKFEGIVAVYDFGGGTFDISILEIIENSFEVLTTYGDSYLGGEDIDKEILNHLLQDFQHKQGIDLSQDMVAYSRLKEAAEAAKCDLSTTHQVQISLPFITQKNNSPLHFEYTLKREDFERWIEPLVKRTLDCCQEALNNANLKKRSINRVIMVGGSTRIPLVQELVEEFFDQELRRDVNPDEIVALGAATQAGVLSGGLDEVVLLDITPHTLGIEIKDSRFSPIIQRNSTIPIKASKTFTTTEDNQEFVNIHVLQGDDLNSINNVSLGKFTLTGITPMKAGMPRIDVTFFINSDGIVEVTATDVLNPESEPLTVRHSFLSNDEQISRNVRASRRKKKSRAAQRGAADSVSILRGTPLKKNGDGAEDGASAADSRAGLLRGEAFQEVSARFTSGEALAFVDASAEDADAHVTVIEPLKGGGPSPHDTTEVQLPPKALTARKAETPPAAGRGGPETEKNVAARPQPELLSAAAAAPAEQLAPAARSAKQPPETQAQPAIAAAKSSGVDTDADFVRLDDSRELDPHETPLERSATAEYQLPALAFTAALPQAAPELLRLAAQLLREHPAVETQRELEAALPAIQQLAEDHGAVYEARMLLFLALIHLNQGEEVLRALDGLCEKFPRQLENTLKVFTLFVKKNPKLTLAWKARGRLHEELGKPLRAIRDYERALQQETADEEISRTLQRLYHQQLKQDPRATVQFKIVKLHLRKNEIDEAISILQQIQGEPTCEQKATKILGLCFWQKHMYYLAWQKFKTLPVTEEIKDVLYRLASDMEAADQLTNAKYSLERILEYDYQYKDVEDRIQKINERIRRQQESLQLGGGGAEPGRVLKDSRFIILEEIARGSMGIIYRAKDKILDEIVALKVLNEYLCSDPAAIERFKREARAAKRLSHPNIVRIHDMYENSGKMFISMEYIEGSDLKQILAKRARLSWPEMRTIALEMCDALKYAHKLNIIHRDIKPANVMITSDSDVRITDFGIAKWLHAKDATKSSSMIMGTPLYMSPEQIEGGEIDARTDIYTLGVMFWEMAGGHPPYHDGNIEYQHVFAEIPRLPDDVQPPLAEMIYRCMAKKPQDRFQSISEVQKIVQQIE